jgi:cytochrome P450
LELAKDQELQARLRQETKDTRRRLLEQGQPEIEMDDYERMPLLTAFIKAGNPVSECFVMLSLIQEVLRFHPVASNGNRTALQDTVIPLAHPIKLASGEIMTEIQVSKGQNINLNLPGFNR